MKLADKYYRVGFRDCFVAVALTVLNLSGVRNNYSLISHRESRVGYFSHQILQGGVNWVFLYPSVSLSLDQRGGVGSCNLSHHCTPRGDLPIKLNLGGKYGIRR